MICALHDQFEVQLPNNTQSNLTSINMFFDCMLICSQWVTENKPQTSCRAPQRGRRIHRPLMTLVLAHDACLAHDVGDHPECPARVKRILTSLQKRFPNLQLTQPPLGTQQQLLSFHSKEHVDRVLGLCAQVLSGPIVNYLSAVLNVVLLS